MWLRLYTPTIWFQETPLLNTNPPVVLTSHLGEGLPDIDPLKLTPREAPWPAVRPVENSKKVLATFPRDKINSGPTSFSPTVTQALKVHPLIQRFFQYPFSLSVIKLLLFNPLKLYAPFPS